jgi:hypothetical protein
MNSLAFLVALLSVMLFLERRIHFSLTTVFFGNKAPTNKVTLKQ